MRIPEKNLLLISVALISIASLFLCIICSAGQSASTARRNPTPRRLILQPCKVPEVSEELWCGKWPVYENRQTMRGRQLLLNIVVLPAPDQSTKTEPLFDLQGGPGYSATANAKFYTTDLKEYRRNRDVVLVDQRGTGESNPLRCAADGFDEQKFMDDMYPPDFVNNCRRMLEQRADLTQYTTPVAMDDLDDVRAALGYERINLSAVSYGTRAALVYMRRHPAHVRSVVLMGAVPMFAKLPLNHARNAQRAMELLFEDCAADAPCQKAFPNLRHEFNQLIESLERQPAHIRFASTSTGWEREFVIRRGFFAENLRSHMYTPPEARQIPYIIDRAARGDFRPFLSFAMPKPWDSSDPFAGGLYLSVTCSEDVSRIKPVEAVRFTRGTFLGDYRIFQQRRACQLWPRTKLPRGYYEPVVSDVPVLIIAGRLDPVTPPEWSEEIARTLSNSKVILIPQDTHLPLGINFECMDRLIVQFINQGNTKGLDFASCAGQIQPPPFQTEALPSATSAGN